MKSTELAPPLQTVAPMVTLKDGRDVTESLHDLPVGTALIVRRADGATMDAMWDGERLASPRKGMSRVYTHGEFLRCLDCSYMLKYVKKNEVMFELVCWRQRRRKG